MKMNREMFEGKDYPTQWALNPSMYQNMSNDEVDWAALAQQWIKMKETVVPPAPPPPTLSNNDMSDDGGEAPMDMDTKDDDVPPAPPAPNISGNDNWSQWSQWGQWNTSAPGGGCWEWIGVPPPGVTIGPDGKPMGIPSMPSVPPAPNISNRTSFNVPPTTSTSPYTYNSVSANQATFNQVPGYWTGGDQSNIMPSQGASPFIKGMRHNSRIPPHMRNIDPMRGRDDKEKTPEDDTNMTIDAAKRRQLPAWIREGLEKMEREKHKAVERERQELLRRQEIEARKQAEDEARAVLDPAKSKFDSDSEKEAEQDSEDREEYEEDRQDHEGSPEIIVRPRRSRFRDADSPESRIINNERESPVTANSITGASVKRSREEILQDVMLKVRRSLTEILLEVTNEEISSVCREVWSRYRAKAHAGEPPVASYTNTAPLAQITRKLGLGIYGDSNSESEEELEPQQTDDDDSDLELKETLRRRQSAFKKTEEEIEARLAKEEENEQRIEDYSNIKYENHANNDGHRQSVDDKEINNERDESATQSSSDGHTPKRQIQTMEYIRTNQSTSRSMDSLSSSSRSSTSSTSDSSTSDSSRNVKKRRKRKSKSRSRSRKSRSSSRSKDKRTHRKRFRSSSSGRKSGNKRSRERKRRSGRSSNSRSRSRRRSRSHSRRKSRDRRRNTRSRSRNNRKRSSRSHSRSERGRSRSYGHASSSSSLKRRSSRSKDRIRRSRSRNHRDGKKSAHRYRN